MNMAGYDQALLTRITHQKDHKHQDHSKHRGHHKHGQALLTRISHQKDHKHQDHSKHRGHHKRQAAESRSAKQYNRPLTSDLSVLLQALQMIEGGEAGVIVVYLVSFLGRMDAAVGDTTLIKTNSNIFAFCNYNNTLVSFLFAGLTFILSFFIANDFHLIRKLNIISYFIRT